jgi:hypothetical protein
MSKFLTPKQIAQTYVVNDIIVHELILDALNEVETCSKINNISPTIYDVISRVCNLASQDQMFTVFELDTNDILRTVKNEYMEEIANLVKMLATNFKD